MTKNKPVKKIVRKEGEVQYICPICHIKQFAEKGSDVYCSVCDSKMTPSGK